MSQTPLSDDDAKAAVAAFKLYDEKKAAAEALGLKRQTFCSRLKVAAERGLLGPAETLPGYAIKSITRKEKDGSYVKQTKAPGPEFAPTDGLIVKGKTSLVGADGRILMQHIMERASAESHAAKWRAAIEGMLEQIVPVAPTPAPTHLREDLVSQYVVTDMHLGALAWGEETGQGDYDLAIGERLLVDWFGAAIAQAPPTKYAVFAQLGDFLHHDSFKSVTPEHGNQLDADSRYPKMVRTAIRSLRRVVGMLLAKHEHVHIVMSDANHDPAGEVWLREMFAILYEDEPRITVDTSPGTFCVYEFGDVSLFYHHGHKRKVSNVDSMFAGRFRSIYGRTRFSYAHTGHRHSDELKTTDLMKVEQHETLAAPDAYGSNWLSGRSAKVIYYHRRRGEVGRNIVTPEMVADFIGEEAA